MATPNCTLVANLLDTAGATVGQGPDVAGRIVIDDISRWTASGPFILGGAGDAILEIESFARTSCFIACVTSPTQGALISPSTILADSASSNVVVTNYGVWNTGDFTVGKAGTAEITLLGRSVGVFPIYPSAGKIESTNVSIGALAGSSGIVNMAGQAPSTPLFSNWNITGSLVLGGTPTTAGGLGRLDIELGNSVAVATTLRVWAGGTLSLAKGAILTVGGNARLAGTLQFDITDGNTPQLNDAYPLLTAGAVIGTFSNVDLPPIPSGLEWSLEYNQTDVTLRVVAGANGDFNNDGIVDAADYVYWRKNPGGDLTPQDYNTWRTNFASAVDGAGATSPAATPEPTILMLMCAPLAAFALTRWRQSRASL